MPTPKFLVFRLPLGTQASYGLRGVTAAFSLYVVETKSTSLKIVSTLSTSLQICEKLSREVKVVG